MIASLPMYAAPRIAAANAHLWAAIRDRLRATGRTAPEKLTPVDGDPMAHWQAPDLMLSQTCGMPYRLYLHGKVTLVGTPDYRVTGCPPGYYRSLVVARRDDPRKCLSEFQGARFAFNDAGSQSGWAALANEAPDVLTGERLCTGAHRASVGAVRDGHADFAAIDAVTWRHLRDAVETTGLRVVHRTPATPGLPFIAAVGVDRDALFGAVSGAIADLDTDSRTRLGIAGFVAIPAETYLTVPTPPEP